MLCCVQEFLSVPVRQRFPAFQELVWHAAIAAAARARAVAGLTAGDLRTRAAAVAEQRGKRSAGHAVGAGMPGTASNGMATQPAEGHSPTATQTAPHRKRSRKQVQASLTYAAQPVVTLRVASLCWPPDRTVDVHAATAHADQSLTASQARPTSAADTAEPGRPPKLLLKLSLSNGGAGRGAAVAGQAGNLTVQPPPTASSVPPATEPKAEEQRPVLGSTQLLHSSDGGTGPAADQPAGVAHVLSPPVTSMTSMSAEDRAAAADWPALLAALRGWSEGRLDGLHLPPAIRDPQVCVPRTLAAQETNTAFKCGWWGRSHCWPVPSVGSLEA